MADNPKAKPDDPEQYKRFLEAAKKAEAADSEVAADKAFKEIIRNPPHKRKKGF